MGPLDFTDEEIREMEDEEQCLLRESVTVGIEEVGGCTVWTARQIGGGAYACGEEEYRVIAEYEAVRERQGAAEEACAVARGFDWADDERAEEDPPEPEAVPPSGTLAPRQALFCENYAIQPVAARAAVLAGYGEENAANQGHRLLKNPLVLMRIADLRAERKVRYVVEADTLHDKLEAVFFEALSDRNHAAAVAALRLQAGLARLPIGAGPKSPAAAAHAKEAAAKAPRRRRREAEKSRPRRRKMTRKADQ